MNNHAKRSWREYNQKLINRGSITFCRVQRKKEAIRTIFKILVMLKIPCHRTLPIYEA